MPKKIVETSYKETTFGIIPRSKLTPLEIEGIKRAWDFILKKSSKMPKSEICTIKECFETILNGDKEESRQAARKVRKLLYSSQGDHIKFKEIKELVNNAPNEYEKIPEDWRQENFVMSISVIYYLHDRENEPDFLFPWLFQLLQHKNGYIRHAAVKMICHEIGPLTYHIRFPGDKSIWHKFSPEQADNILRCLFTSLNDLLSILWQPKYKRYKYVDSLPTSPYKSVQMVLADLEESCE